MHPYILGFIEKCGELGIQAPDLISELYKEAQGFSAAGLPFRPQVDYSAITRQRRRPWTSRDYSVDPRDRLRIMQSARDEARREALSQRGPIPQVPQYTPSLYQPPPGVYDPRLAGQDYMANIAMGYEQPIQLNGSLLTGRQAVPNAWQSMMTAGQYNQPEVFSSIPQVDRAAAAQRMAMIGYGRGVAAAAPTAEESLDLAQTAPTGSYERSAWQAQAPTPELSAGVINKPGIKYLPYGSREHQQNELERQIRAQTAPTTYEGWKQMNQMEQQLDPRQTGVYRQTIGERQQRYDEEMQRPAKPFSLTEPGVRLDLPSPTPLPKPSGYQGTLGSYTKPSAGAST